MIRWFDGDHLPDNLKEIVEECRILAHIIDGKLPDSDEKTAGLRKLLEAKDCFVRAKLTAE